MLGAGPGVQGSVSGQGWGGRGRGGEPQRGSVGGAEVREVRPRAAGWGRGRPFGGWAGLRVAGALEGAERGPLYEAFPPSLFLPSKPNPHGGGREHAGSLS